MSKYSNTIISLLLILLLFSCKKEIANNNDMNKISKKENVKKTEIVKNKETEKLELPEIVAKIDGEEIKKDFLLKQISTMDEQFKKFKNSVNLSQKKEIAKNLLQNHIKSKLIEKELSKSEFDIDNKDVEKELISYKKKFKDDDEFQKFLKFHKLTEEKLKSEIILKLKTNLFIEKEVTSKIRISDESILKYYNENKEEFLEKEQIKVKHILIKSSENDSKENQQLALEKAKKIFDKLKKGESFEVLAKTESETSLKATGGDLGWLSKGRMIKEFEEAAFKLNKGEISEIVKTTFGYHIIKVEDKKSEHQKELTDVKQIIELKLKNIETNLKLNEFYSKLNSKYKVEIFIK